MSAAIELPNHKIHLKCTICDAELHTDDYSAVTTFAMEHEQARHKFKTAKQEGGI